MPARYRPGSEYKKKFRWHESVKSASFTPAPEQNAPKAGLASGDIGYVRSEFREPPLQRRGKPLPGQLTHTIKQVNLVPSDTDSNNVGKTRPALASAKTYKIPQHHTAADTTSDGRKPGIRTNGEAKLSRKLTTHTNGEANEPVTGRLRDAPDVGVTRAVSTHRKERHDSGERSSDINRNNNRTTNKKAKTSRSGVDTTATRNGSSGDRAQPNIALQYQAGIHPNRPKGAKYLSEYQRQFEWKKPLPKESPLIAAEQMVYNSNTNIAPYVPDKIPRHTEYQKQFKAWQPIQPSPQEQLVENAQREIKAKYMVKTKSKKSKKTNTTPDRMRAAGVPSVTSHENIQQLKASQNPQQPFFPHSTIRKWKSEYRSNFKSPHKFSYEDGVWKGAGPPHIQPKDDSHSDNGRRETAAAASPLRRTKSQHDLPNWFAEVLELRKKAQEYQQRARGTHFSREHMAQLIARQAQMWDASSTTASSTTSSLSAPSVEANRPEDARIPARDIHPTSTGEPVSRPGPIQDNNNNVSPARRKLAWPEDSPADRLGDRLGDRPGNRPSERLGDRPGNRPSDRLGDRPGNRPSPPNNGDQESSIGSIPTPEGYRGSVSASSDDFEIVESNGRPPTPQLKEKGIEQRHHLNRTTPAVGGAILTSPKPVRKQPPHSTAPGRTYVAKSAPPRTPVIDGPRGPTILPGGTDKGFDWFTSDEDDPPTPRTHTPPPPPAQQTRILQKVQASPPAAGISTRDPHRLNQKLRSPTFQRHSKNFYETSSAMPEMPRGISNPPAIPHTWAAQRDTGYTRPRGRGSVGEVTESDSDDENVRREGTEDEEVRRMRTMSAIRDEVRREELDRPRPATMHAARQGPLDRPNSGSMYGRPMTAHPQTRQAAIDAGIPSNPNRNDPVGINPSRVENGRPTGKTWTVPREANVNAHSSEGDLLSTPRGSISDRLSMSGISSVSSSSLASEVLERARKRRDDFWGTP